MNIVDDNTILWLLKQKDESGYRALFDKYYKSLCIKAYMLLNNKEEAEDIVQDVFLKFWQENRFNTIEHSLGSYLLISVKNAAYNFLKKKNSVLLKEKEFTRTLDEVTFLNIPENDEVAAAIEKAMTLLPGQCKLAFELVCIEGKKYKEASDIMGVSVNTTKTQLKRAFQKLRETLKAYNKLTGYMSPILFVLLS